jgi:hypothetical protein
LTLKAVTESNSPSSGLVQTIAAHVEWGRGSLRYRVDTRDLPGGSEWVVIDGRTDRETLRRLPKPDWVSIAAFVVGREISRSLAGHVDVAVLPLRGLAMRHVPDCLLAAAYLKFATEVAAGVRNPSLRVCANPEHATTSPDELEVIAGPRNRMYCTDRCKDRAKYLRGIAASTT